MNRLLITGGAGFIGSNFVHDDICDASPDWFAKVSPRYLCKTIAVEVAKK